MQWGLQEERGEVSLAPLRAFLAEAGVMAYFKFKAARETVAHDLMRKTGRPRRSGYTVCCVHWALEPSTQAD